MKRLPTDALVIAALVALALVVRSLFVGLVGLAHDEPFTVYWAHRPLAGCSPVEARTTRRSISCW
ncbi:MAG: hypothetical protein IPM68_09060 [Flavobacteriales bacterium]|nr:hypothetical protein [Flavobacteriales bacterium]